jgi:hypothetical protein
MTQPEKSYTQQLAEAVEWLNQTLNFTGDDGERTFEQSELEAARELARRRGSARD